MLKVDEQLLKSILSISDSADFLIIKEWINKSYKDSVDSLHESRDSTVTAVFQGSCCELRELIDVLDNARIKLVNINNFNDSKTGHQAMSKGPAKNFLT